MINVTPKDIARFWSYVDKRGDKECWPWLLTMGTAPILALHGRNVSAMRLMWELTTERPIDPNLNVLRTCGAHCKECINPAHMILAPKGTKYSTWWKGRMRKARSSIHELADLAGFTLVPTKEYYHVVPK